MVIIFYPLDFTFVCPTELVGFNKRLQEFKNLNCEVIAVSTDSKYSHLKWNQIPINQGGLGGIQIPLVSDYEKTMAVNYKVLVQTGGDIGACFRGLFVIDKTQTIRHMSVNDLPVGRSVDEVLRLVEAYQFTDEHGEVCPLNWKKGSATMVDNPVDSMKYFEKL